jgi:deazaflavin-dependent oxidoreductase (nitroreductase family)
MAQAEKIKDHVALYLATDGAEGHMWDKLSAPGTYACLLLTTTGRKSGESRTTPLVYGRDGDNYVVVASQGGRPTHPAWYLNLVENPFVDVQVAAEKFTATAREANGKERARLWQLMAGVYPMMDEYEKRIGDARVIPVVVLMPQ